MRRDRLLLHVVADLENLLETAEEYPALRASGLLRLMLLDREPLLLHVAKSHEVPLAFSVAGTRLPGSEVYGGGVTAKVPALRSPNAAGNVQLSLEGLLKFEAMHVRLDGVDLVFTVRTAIRVAAIAFGGVHFMEPDRAEDVELARLVERLDPDSARYVAIAVSGIGHVVVDSCRELVEHLAVCRSESIHS